MVIVFDLDDTLYPEVEFVRSGFWAVARHLDADRPLPIYSAMMATYNQHGSGRVFDRYAEQSSQSLDIGRLVEIYRFHDPWIQLNVAARVTLTEAKARFATALVTDGALKMQRNKFLALGLERYIDFPVFTDELNTKKPDPAPFLEVVKRFGEDRRYAYVADNPAKDFLAPRELGWTTIRLRRADGVYRHLEGDVDHEICAARFVSVSALDFCCPWLLLLVTDMLFITPPGNEYFTMPRETCCLAGEVRVALVMLFFLLGIQTATGQPASGRPNTNVRDDGVILLNGRPFLPLGVYHAGLNSGRSGDAIVEDMATIAEAGFNLVHLSMDFTADGERPESSTAGRIARAARAQGLHLGVYCYLPSLERVAAEHARWPEVLFSMIGDDFNTDKQGRHIGPPKFPPEELRRFNQRVKRVAPDQLTYSSGSAARVARLRGYHDSVDCIGVQVYPLGNGNQSYRNELEAMDDTLANYWRLAGPKANKALIANLQAFAWMDERIPKTNEVRLQAWVSLLNQAKGLVWYSYLPTGRSLVLPKAHPHLWSELKQLVLEIGPLAPAILDGDFHRFPNPDDPFFADGGGIWHAGYWRYGDELLLVVVNTHRERAMTIDLSLPDDGKRLTRKLFDRQRYATDLRVDDGKLQGNIDPHSVAVYKLN